MSLNTIRIGLTLVLASLPMLSAAKTISLPIYTNPKYAVSAIQYPEFQLITFAGSTDPIKQEPNPFRRFLSKLHPTKPILLWVVRSSGGYGKGYIDAIESLKNGGKRHVDMVVDGKCASACTFWAAAADRTYYISTSAFFMVHQGWIFHSSFKIGSAAAAARLYGRLGANEQWFHDNAWLFKSKGNKGGTLSDRQAYASGLVDEDISSKSLREKIGADVYDALKYEMRKYIWGKILDEM